jgi:hypothetical protein
MGSGVEERELANVTICSANRDSDTVHGLVCQLPNPYPTLNFVSDLFLDPRANHPHQFFAGVHSFILFHSWTSRVHQWLELDLISRVVDSVWGEDNGTV